MVKLPEETEQAARPIRGPPNYLTWSYRHRQGHRLPQRTNAEPKGLLELEALAHRSVQLMEKHGPKSENNFSLAMDLLRLHYNLNFIVVCEKCGGPHPNDELIAPER